MSKFKIGDVVRLKDNAMNWSDALFGKDIVVSSNGTIWEGSPMSSAQCVAEYPDDFELVEDVSKRHFHHDMIVEWAKDPSRVVEYYDDDTDDWQDCSDSGVGVPVWDAHTKYRFKPTEPERVSLSGVFPETSLTIDQLLEVYEDTYTHREGIVAVANASIKQYILEQENILDTEKNDD